MNLQHLKSSRAKKINLTGENLTIPDIMSLFYINWLFFFLGLFSLGFLSYPS